MFKSKWLVQLTWLPEFEFSECLQKKMSGKLKKMQFFLVLSPFCYHPMKHREGKKPNTSDVGPHGWHS